MEQEKAKSFGKRPGADAFMKKRGAQTPPPPGQSLPEPEAELVEGSEEGRGKSGRRRSTACREAYPDIRGAYLHILSLSSYS